MKFKKGDKVKIKGAIFFKDVYEVTFAPEGFNYVTLNDIYYVDLTKSELIKM